MNKILASVLMGLALIGSNLPSIPTTYGVLDADRHLSDATVRHIGQNNDQLYFDTGSEIFFYVMNFVPMGQYIDLYGLDVFNNWQIGRPDTNNGILVTIAVAEDPKQFAITPGYGILNQLSAAALNNIVDNYFLDYLDAGLYDMAVTSLFDALSREVYRLFPPETFRYGGNNPVATPAPIATNVVTPTQNNGVGFEGIVIAIIIIIVFASIFGGGRRRRRGIGRRGMGGAGTFMGGFMMGRMTGGHNRGGWGGSAPPRSGGTGGLGGNYRPPTSGGGLGGSTPRRPGGGGFGGYSGGRGGYSRGGGISRGGMGGRRR